MFKFGKVRYEGDYLNGSKTGWGRFTTYNGHHYEGMFLDGKFHGQGTYYSADRKRTYIGMFRDNTLKKGRMELADGTYYEGELKDELMHGAGALFYSNGDAYVGTFSND